MKSQTFFQRFKSNPILHLIGIFAVLLGILFLIMQGGKVIKPSHAELEMQKLPFGTFDWGYVWSDIFFIIPLLTIGGILILFSNSRGRRLGKLFAFAGFSLNSYALVFFWVGFNAIGEFVPGSILGSITLPDLIFLVLCLLSMVYLAINIFKEEG